MQLHATSAQAGTLKLEAKVLELTIQQVLDVKELDQFWHQEIPARVPLVLSDHLIGTSLNLQKFSRPVRFVEDSKRTGAFLRFTGIDCKELDLGLFCNISFQYPIEGVMGRTVASISKNGSVKLEGTSVFEN